MMRGAFIRPAALAITLSLSCPTILPAKTNGLDFDQGIDISRTLDKVRETAKHNNAQIAATKIGSSHYEESCVDFTFQPNDNPVSSPVWLQSREWREDCHLVCDHNNHCHQQCWQTPGFLYQKIVQVTLRNRQQLFPWEYDSFQACLRGPWLNFYALETAYKYRLIEGNSNYGNFVLEPTQKIPMKPDPFGIQAQSLTPAMVLTLQDRWFSYYKGEQTVLNLVLKKQVDGWFDTTILEKEITFPADASYQVQLADPGLMEPGSKYYVKYSFRRIGKISKDTLTKGGETQPVVYEPAKTLAARQDR